MTTIAYKDGIMAGDTQVTWGSEADYGIVKVYRTKKHLLGISGNWALHRPYFDWIMKIETDLACPTECYRYKEDLLVDFNDSSGTLILVNESQQIWSIQEADSACFINRTHMSIGSGNKYAQGAMASGLSAPLAVAVASNFDVYTGGSIAYVTFDSPVTDFSKGLTGKTEEGIPYYTVVE